MSELDIARRASLWVSSLHSGGCSACAQSIAALEAPRYAQRLRALGVTFARTPRHSDVILLCGALTEQARVSIAALVEGTPRPRALVAVGDCAINGCVFAGSPALTTPLAQALDVNVELSGCPPAPEAIIEAIAQAQRLLISHDAATTASPAETTPARPSAATPSGAPDHATRLASLIEAAGSDWGDEEETQPDDTTTHHGLEHHHLAEKRNGATTSARSEENRR